MELQQHNRKFMISWLILPVLFVWISTNYLLGISRHTVWETQSDPNLSSRVIAGETITQAAPAEFTPVHWQGTGLVTLWFDDAWLSQFTVAYPILTEEKLPAALAVPTTMVGYDDYMSWNQIQMLARKGWEITSHTRHHSCDPNQLTDHFVQAELEGAKEDLATQGFTATDFVTPCGLKSNKLDTEAKKYYLSLRTTDTGLNPLPVTNPYSLKIEEVDWVTTSQDVAGWLETAKKNRQWLILVFHQVDEKENKFGTSPQKLEQMVKLVVDSKLPVVVPTQALQLIDDSNKNL